MLVLAPGLTFWAWRSVRVGRTVLTGKRNKKVEKIKETTASSKRGYPRWVGRLLAIA